MSNFDLKKFLIENKLTSNSKKLYEYENYEMIPASKHESNKALGIQDALVKAGITLDQRFNLVSAEGQVQPFEEGKEYSYQEIVKILSSIIKDAEREFTEDGSEFPEMLPKWDFEVDTTYEGEGGVVGLSLPEADTILVVPTSNSKALSEQPSRDKVTDTEWNVVNGKYQPTITFQGKQYTLEFDDQVRGDDSGTVIQTYFTDELPGYEFEIMAAYQGVHYPADPTYYYDGKDWEVIEP